MGDSGGKAEELVRKADKKLTSFALFGNKYEDAAELYEKAVTQYKLAKLWAEAGQTSEKLAQCHLRLDSRHEAANAYVEAAKAYQKTSKNDVLRALHRAKELYTEIGRLGMAAKQLREVGETMEKQGSKEESIPFYEEAAELFDGEGQSSEANKCRLKVAQFSAEVGRYPEAISIYESVARACVDNALLKYSAKGYLLNAGLCQLCVGDEVAMQSALQRYEDIDFTFAGSREGNLYKDLVEAYEQADTEKFTEVIAEFDSMTRLDAWKTALLLRVKKKMAAIGEGGEEDLT